MNSQLEKRMDESSGDCGGGVWVVNMDIKYSAEYIAIHNHYLDKTAARSGVPLINHINEGLAILDILGASDTTKKAFCLHPLFQGDDDLISNLDKSWVFLPKAVLLAMEYRARANDWLSDKVFPTGARTIINGEDVPYIGTKGLPSYGVLPEVKQMLIAGKVQNYKDFCLYHKGTHGRSDELEVYFATWLDTLGVGVKQYESLIKDIS